MRPNVSSTSLTAAKKEITGNWNAKSVPIAEQVPRGDRGPLPSLRGTSRSWRRFRRRARKSKTRPRRVVDPYSAYGTGSNPRVYTTSTKTRFPRARGVRSIRPPYPFSFAVSSSVCAFFGGGGGIFRATMGAGTSGCPACRCLMRSSVAFSSIRRHAHT